MSEAGNVEKRAVRDLARDKARIARDKAKLITPHVEHEIHRGVVDFIRFYVWEFVIICALQIEPSHVVAQAAIIVRRVLP